MSPRLQVRLVVAIVNVRVDEAWQNRSSVEIDDLCVGGYRNLGAPTCSRNQSVTNEDDGILDRLAPCPVDEEAANQSNRPFAFRATARQRTNHRDRRQPPRDSADRSQSGHHSDRLVFQAELASHPFHAIGRRLFVQSVLGVIPTQLLRLGCRPEERLGPFDRHVGVVTSELEEQ